MARVRRSRLELNRARLDEVEAGYADGVFDVARAIMRVAEARAPDATPYGEGLVTRLAAVVWVGRKRTHQVRTDGSSQTIRKPRGSTRLGTGIYGVVGAGFPGMFQEFGTVRHPAQPFLTPAVAEIEPEAAVLLSAAMQRRLRGERSPKTAMIRSRIAAARAGG